MKRIKPGVIFLATGLAACSGPMVQVKHDRVVPFDTLKTYAWQVETPESQIRSDVDQVLAAKGFHAAPDKDADLLLDYEVTSREEVDASHLKNYDTAQFYGLTSTWGTLTLRMQRQASPLVVWEGSVQATIDEAKSPEERKLRLRAAIEALLKKFPPK
jgi:hypothetical protein